MKEFDYKSDYKKFRSGNVVRITFIDGKMPITKIAQIISIDDKKISFEDKENIYECIPKEILRIKKNGIMDYILSAILIEFVVIPCMWQVSLGRTHTIESAEYNFFAVYLIVPLLIFLYFSIMLKDSPEKFAWKMMAICLFLFKLFWVLMALL